VTPAVKLLDLLHMGNPYAGFPYRNYQLDLQGGGESPLFRQVLKDLRPVLVIEVGSWKGASAVQVAKAARELGLPTAVLCVDTWLGSLEHLTGRVDGWSLPGDRQFGYPTLYFQFLANVLHCGCEDRIVPVPNTSANAARWFGRVGVLADMIYVDASHEEDDVYQDLCLYWHLLRPGGILLGDDWNAYWYGVICAVNRFAKEKRVGINIIEPHWMIMKPKD